MEFVKTEIIFYATITLFGLLGGISRHLRDRLVCGWAGIFGRCLSSGLVTFGVVGVWIGDNPNIIVSPIYYLALSVLVGYATYESPGDLISRLLSLKGVSIRARSDDKKSD